MPTERTVPAARRPRVICHMMTSIDGRERGVSYLLAGAREIDLPLALEAVEQRADDVLWLRYRIVR